MRQPTLDGHCADLRAGHLEAVHAPVMDPAVVRLREGRRAELTLVADAEVLAADVAVEDVLEVGLVAADRADEGPRGRPVDVGVDQRLAWKWNGSVFFSISDHVN